MKYRFAVTEFVDKEIEIEAATADEAYEKMDCMLYDVDMSDGVTREFDREFLMLDE